MKRRAKRIAAVALAIFIAAAIMGSVWEWSAVSRFRSPFQSEGQNISIDSGDLHFILRGDRNAETPLVIVDAALGGCSYEWLHIADKVDDYAQILLWDRHGNFLSPPARDVQGPRDNIEDLRDLLDELELTPPYLLVGNSLGGLNMRLFATQHPEEVSGLLLVDALNIDHMNFSDQIGPPAWLHVLAATRAIGLPRLLETASGNPWPIHSGIRGEELFEIRMNGYQAGGWSEFRGLQVYWTKHPEGMSLLGDLPTTVITANGPPNAQTLKWRAGQAALKTVANNVRFVNSECHHLVHLDKPDLVCDELSLLYRKCSEDSGEPSDAPESASRAF